MLSRASWLRNKSTKRGAECRLVFEWKKAKQRKSNICFFFVDTLRREGQRRRRRRKKNIFFLSHREQQQKKRNHLFFSISYRDSVHLYDAHSSFSRRNFDAPVISLHLGYKRSKTREKKKETRAKFVFFVAFFKKKKTPTIRASRNDVFFLPPLSFFFFLFDAPRPCRALVTPQQPPLLS